MPSTRSTSSAGLLAAVALQVACASLAAQQLRTLPRQGLTLPTMSEPYSVAVADFDQDGDPDVLFACKGIPVTIQDRLYRNDGRGRFDDVTSSNLPAVLDASNMVEVGDLDGDGDLDVVVAHDGGLSISS